MFGLLGIAALLGELERELKSYSYEKCVRKQKECKKKESCIEEDLFLDALANMLAYEMLNACDTEEEKKTEEKVENKVENEIENKAQKHFTRPFTKEGKEATWTIVFRNLKNVGVRTADDIVGVYSELNKGTVLRILYWMVEEGLATTDGHKVFYATDKLHKFCKDKNIR